MEQAEDIAKEKEGNSAGDEFVYLASHQLRSPITHIKWIVDLLLETEKLTPRTRKYLVLMRSSAVRLSDLIALLLNVSRIERGKVFLSPRSFDVVEFTKSFLNEYIAFSKKKKISLIFKKYPSALPAFIDSGAFYNILQSLVSNAIDYTLEGGTVEILLEKKNKEFRLTVRDTGIGIPKKDQARIFEKFNRAGNAQEIKEQGLGLGLYVAARTVQLLNGKIWFDSPALVETSAGKKEKKGTAFYVELPLKYAN